jgi:hypothetical protein
MGSFTSADEFRIALLREHLPPQLASLRYVDYKQAERDCEELAVRLLDRLGRDALSDFHFVAIPRGGLIVLGMLSYLLHLDPAQLDPPAAPDTPTVAVDDCAFSGARFGRFLDGSTSHDVVFAHLYSHPDLRSAIEAAESRVQACVAARDLHDYALERLGAEYLAWKDRWKERSGESRYWFGQPELVCFPWNEPDGGFWDPFTEHIERSWRLVPPEYCLKNRPSPDAEPLPIQVQSESSGELMPSKRCLWGELDGKILLADLDTGDSLGLDEVAGDMWRAIVEHGTNPEAVDSLLRIYGTDEATLQTDFHEFAQKLIDLGLLQTGPLA